MDKPKEDKNKKEKMQIDKEDYSNKITYSTNTDEKVDLLDIIEMYLCKSCVRL